MAVLEEVNMIEERDRALEAIAARLRVRAERGKRFAELTSLRVGGSIDWVISPETEAQAAAIVYELDHAGIGWRPLGSGSNVLADDGDVADLAIALAELVVGEADAARGAGDDSLAALEIDHVHGGKPLPWLFCLAFGHRGRQGAGRGPRPRRR